MLAWKKLPKNYIEKGQVKNKSPYNTSDLEKSAKRRYYQTPSLTDSSNYRMESLAGDDRTIRKQALTERGEKRRFDFLGIKQDKKTVGERTPTRGKAIYNVSRNLQADYSPIRNVVMESPRRGSLGLNERLQQMGIKVGALESNGLKNHRNVETIVIQKRNGAKRNHSHEMVNRSGSLKGKFVTKSGKFYMNDKGYVFTPIKGKTERLDSVNGSNRSIKTSNFCCFF